MSDMFTYKEESDIIKYILEQNAFDKLHDINFYKDMIKELKLKRSPGSLRERLNKNIIPLIHINGKFSFLTPKEINLFQTRGKSPSCQLDQLDQTRLNMNNYKENITTNIPVEETKRYTSFKDNQNVDLTVSEDENYKSDDSMSTNATFDSTVMDRVNTDFEAIEDSDNISTRPLASTSEYSKLNFSSLQKNYDITFRSNATLGSTIKCSFDDNLTNENTNMSVRSLSMEVQMDPSENSFLIGSQQSKHFSEMSNFINSNKSTSQRKILDITTKEKKLSTSTKKSPNEQLNETINPNIYNTAIADDNNSVQTTYYSIRSEKELGCRQTYHSTNLMNTDENLIYCVFCGSKIAFSKTLTIVNCVSCKKIFSLTYKKDLLKEVAIIA